MATKLLQVSALKPSNLNSENTSKTSMCLEKKEIVQTLHYRCLKMFAHKTKLVFITPETEKDAF